MSYMDVIIPFHEKDGDIINMCIAGIKKNIPAMRRIYLIGRKNLADSQDIIFINEEEFFSGGLTKGYIEQRLHEKNSGLARRAGWLYQQFIKLGCGKGIADLSEDYLVIDADIVFLKEVYFFRDNKTYLTRTNKLNALYYEMYKRLFKETIEPKFSFIAHHMVMNKVIVNEMLNRIEKIHQKPWYEAIIDNLEDSKSNLSEYELYGQYILRHYPERIILRSLSNIEKFRYKQLIKLFLGMADYATFHNYKKPENNIKTNIFIYNIILRHIKKYINL